MLQLGSWLAISSWTQWQISSSLWPPGSSGPDLWPIPYTLWPIFYAVIYMTLFDSPTFILPFLHFILCFCLVMCIQKPPGILFFLNLVQICSHQAAQGAQGFRKLKAPIRCLRLLFGLARQGSTLPLFSRWGPPSPAQGYLLHLCTAQLSLCSTHSETFSPLRPP